MLVEFRKEDLIDTSRIRQWVADHPNFKCSYKNTDGRYTVNLYKSSKLVNSVSFASLNDVRDYLGVFVKSGQYKKMHYFRDEMPKLKHKADAYSVSKNF